MRKLLLVLGLLFVTKMLYALDPPETYYYTLQHYDMKPSTNITPSTGKVDNVMQLRGNFELMNDTYTVSLSDMTKNLILYSTGGIYVNGEITASSISGVVIDTLTVNSVGANQLQAFTLPTDVIASSVGVNVVGDNQIQSGADITINSLTATYNVSASTGVFTSTVTALAFSGDGSLLTGVTAIAVEFQVSPSTGIADGSLDDAVKITTANVTATGTPSATTVFYGDGSWKAPSGGSSNQYFGADLPCNAYVTNGIAYWKQPNYAISITTITIDYTSDGTDSVFEDGYDVKVDSNTGTFYTIMTSSTTLQITDDDNVSATTGSFKQVSYPAGTVWRFDILTVGSTEGGDPITVLIEWTED